MTPEQAIEKSGSFEGKIYGCNDERFISWAKEYLDKGYKVELKSYYEQGWITTLRITKKEN